MRSLNNICMTSKEYAGGQTGGREREKGGREEREGREGREGKWRGRERYTKGRRSRMGWDCAVAVLLDWNCEAV